MNAITPIYVVLVNEKDEELGLMEKNEAHQKGLLHRAVSVLLFNTKGELLLQQRSFNKYHSAGLWSNTCCTHPYPQESTKNAAIRRLREEMGIVVNDMISFDKIIYYVEFDNNMKEHELDHIFIGISDAVPIINAEEVSDFKYVQLDDLKNQLQQNPQKFTYWFNLIMNTLNLPDIKSILKNTNYDA
ncbi:MAG: isopentenyl-diphosphate Delta-isomerase [Bacteroidia bacterium]|nr:isopentenyl-diphosphate Delta-isomerase [Bacteroidia bacterium]